MKTFGRVLAFIVLFLIGLNCVCAQNARELELRVVVESNYHWFEPDKVYDFRFHGNDCGEGFVIADGRDMVYGAFVWACGVEYSDLIRESSDIWGQFPYTLKNNGLFYNSNVPLIPLAPADWDVFPNTTTDEGGVWLGLEFTFESKEYYIVMLTVEGSEMNLIESGEKF